MKFHPFCTLYTKVHCIFCVALDTETYVGQDSQAARQNSKVFPRGLGIPPASIPVRITQNLIGVVVAAAVVVVVVCGSSSSSSSSSSHSSSN